MSTEQRATVDAILRRAAFTVDSSVDEQRRQFRETASAQPLPAFADAGFYVIDLDGLREGGQMHQLGGPLAGQNLIHLP